MFWTNGGLVFLGLCATFDALVSSRPRWESSGPQPGELKADWLLWRQTVEELFVGKRLETQFSISPTAYLFFGASPVVFIQMNVIYKLFLLNI